MGLKYFGPNAKRWYIDNAPPRLDFGEAVRSLKLDFSQTKGDSSVAKAPSE